MINVTSIENHGLIKGTKPIGGNGSEVRFSANFSLLLIGAAWRTGCDFEDLADGFGPGNGTCGGDWSGIRDSSEEATVAMLNRALAHLNIE
jgi:hypothetical protein